jgi:hypothetical protein
MRHAALYVLLLYKVLPSIDENCRRFSLLRILSSLSLLRALRLVTTPAPIVLNHSYSLTFNREEGDVAAFTLQLFWTNTTQKVGDLITELDFNGGITFIRKIRRKIT